MDIELLEIRDFLQLYHPFDQLPEQALNELPEKLQVRYFRRETAIPDGDDLVSFLYLVRTGAVEIRNAEQELFARLGEGDVFGYRTSSRDDPQAYNAVAIEDSLLYLLPAREVDDLCERYAQFAYFYVPVGGDYLSDRMGPYFRLDFRIDKTYIKKKSIWSVYLDIQNLNYFVYNSPEGYTYNYDFSKRKDYGWIFMPALGCRVEF